MLLTHMIAYITGIYKRVEKPSTYGSELEQYITSKSPQSTYDVDYWTRQFDKNTQKGWTL